MQLENGGPSTSQQYGVRETQALRDQAQTAGWAAAASVPPASLRDAVTKATQVGPPAITSSPQVISLTHGAKPTHDPEDAGRRGGYLKNGFISIFLQAHIMALVRLVPAQLALLRFEDDRCILERVQIVPSNRRTPLSEGLQAPLRG